MDTYSQILSLSFPVVAVSIGSTLFTLVCFYYRESIARLYFSLRSHWHSHRESVPRWMLLAIKTVILIHGTCLILAGFILMPLPGPGALVVLLGAALIDFEFGWFVPLLESMLEYCPTQWTPESLKRGLARIKNDKKLSTE